MPEVSGLEFIRVVQRGEVVSFPTDTVPALASLPEAGQEIFTVKQRPADKPLILMGARVEDFKPYVRGSEADWAIWGEMMTRYWPGQVTLILPASDQVPPAMTPGDPQTLGLRIPDLAIAQEILAQTGPLATTSANLSGEPPLETLAEIGAAFPSVFTLSHPDVPPNAKLGNGQPSTVAKWTTTGWVILRQGNVVLSEASSDE
ncbi:L-threonylcarbamoyladenylate synthase [Spirulina subsalsa]|uniref:L-threonylcarbamoyladenylate synthase n=1 Tax=Spirulina subsalsa TaxID=54311 RepID=UPI000309D2FE|nr:L-threonylcarbamoyladenylate synthase [Spirulina subsalsa]